MRWKGTDPPTTTAKGDGTDTAGLERGEGAADFGLAGKEATDTPLRKRLAAFFVLAVLAGAVGATIVLVHKEPSAQPSAKPVVDQPWVRDEEKVWRMGYQAIFGTQIQHGNQTQDLIKRYVNVDLIYKPNMSAPKCDEEQEDSGHCTKVYKLALVLRNITGKKNGEAHQVFYSYMEDPLPPWTLLVTANNTIIKLTGEANVSEAMKMDIKETARLAFPELAKRNFVQVDTSGRRSFAPGFSESNTTQMPAPQGGRVNSSNKAFNGNGTTTLRVTMKDNTVVNQTLPLSQSVQQEATFDEVNGTLLGVNYSSTHVVGDEHGVQPDGNISSVLDSFIVQQESSLQLIEPGIDEGADNWTVANEEELNLDTTHDHSELETEEDLGDDQTNSTAVWVNSTANGTYEPPSSASTAMARRLMCKPPVSSALSKSSLSGGGPVSMRYKSQLQIFRTRVLGTVISAFADLDLSAQRGTLAARTRVALELGSRKENLVSMDSGGGTKTLEEEKSLGKACFPVYWVIEVCIGWNANWQTYVNSPRSNQIRFNQGLRAGLDVYGEVNARVAAAGVYARGDLINLEFPLFAEIDGKCVELTWEGRQTAFSTEFGMYYKVLQCRFKRWKWRCSMSGKRNIGTPARWGSGGTNFDIVKVCL